MNQKPFVFPTLLLCFFLSGCVFVERFATIGGPSTHPDKYDSVRQAAYDNAAFQQRQNARNAPTDGKVSAAVDRKFLSGGLTGRLSLDVRVERGIVTVFGTVPSREVANRAIDIARRVPGVKQVISELVIYESTLTTTGRPAYPHVLSPRFQESAQQPPGSGPQRLPPTPPRQEP